MILGLGLDIVEVDRIRKAHARHGDRFVSRILTGRETALMPPADPAPYLAARFAAKEAAVKALGTGFSEGIGFKDISVERDERGKPSLRFSGKAQERAQALGADKIHVSLTHGRDAASAVVILEALPKCQSKPERKGKAHVHAASDAS